MVHRFKVNNKGAVCPGTGAPLFANSKDTLQSLNNSFFLHLTFMKETKEACDYFKKDIDTIEASSKALNMKIATNCDMMCAQWKVLYKGGTLKCDHVLCHCGDRKSEELHQFNKEPCDVCYVIRKGNIPEGLKCFHEDDILSEMCLDELQRELDELETAMSHLQATGKGKDREELVRKLQINYCDPRIEVTWQHQEGDIKSNHFNLA
jgi:hypothetical protein